jgi:uncharacterized protein (DUF488 family)
MRLYTIGGYGHTEKSFINALKSNNIDLFVDVRQRRGMRGATYSFLNAKKLEENLKSAEISYLHFKDLAPTNEVRSFQMHQREIETGYLPISLMHTKEKYFPKRR